MSRQVELFFINRQAQEDQATSHRLKTLEPHEQCLVEDYRTEPPTRYLIRNLGQSATIGRTEAAGVLHDSDLQPFGSLSPNHGEQGWPIRNALGMAGIILARLGPDRPD